MMRMLILVALIVFAAYPAMAAASEGKSTKEVVTAQKHRPVHQKGQWYRYRRESLQWEARMAMSMNDRRTRSR